eukprot:jgi/Orpsp1_1/1185820/evm.model.c7180000095487.1
MKAYLIASVLAACLVGYTKASCAEANAQCGGSDFAGETCCVEGTECTVINEWYSECVPINANESDVEEISGSINNEEDSAVDTEEENQVPEYPKGTGIQLYTQCKNPKHWAMTYDDGPTIYTDIMLDLFKKYNMKVTFFVTGNLTLKAEDPEWTRMIKRMYNEGHVIGNHTFNHLRLPDQTEDVIRNEMKMIEDLLVKVIGKKPAFMRLPYGASSPEVLNTLESLGYNAAVNWNVDTVDWGNEGDIDYAKKVITEKLGQPIITLNHLMFDGATEEKIVALATAEIEYILSNGYTPVTMEECLGMNAYQ